ncbi:hypothetical protein CNR29_01245 [Levilactobacillus brevis]|uniref:Uncharacterized protein n=1 Tax=Levilactobacillus brevis TaxID=1580 RepID=A0A2A3TVK4_LEVBR|nr:hypothetical protein CNR29_01245 [Levilactobacillus brevis]
MKIEDSLFLYNSEIFYAFTQDILRSHPYLMIYLLLTKSYINYQLFSTKTYVTNKENWLADNSFPKLQPIPI